MKDSTKTSYLKKSLFLTWLLCAPSLALYNNIKQHPTKECVITGIETRIKNILPGEKFFLSFWVKFTATARMRKPAESTHLVSKLGTDPNQFKEITQDAWVFYIIVYQVGSINSGPTSYQLTWEATQTSNIDDYSDCVLTPTPTCTGQELALGNNDHKFLATITLGTADSHTFRLSQLDGQAPKQEARNLISGMMTIPAGNGIVSGDVAAELMKGELELPITEVSFVNLD